MSASGALDLSKIEIDKDHLVNVRTNIEHNKPILKFYNRLLFNTRFTSNVQYREKIKESENYNADGIVWNLPYVKTTTLENKIGNLMNCNNLWLMNTYENEGIKNLLKFMKLGDKDNIKDFIKTNLCKDRFCANCKKVKQASRMARFMPHIKEIGESYHLYHLTLTVPNCTGDNLRETIQKMNKSFARITEYLNPDRNKKISGVDFYRFGYVGAIRSLEVTFKKDSYHPHFHVLLALDFEEPEKHIVNAFSKRNGKNVRKFSNLEILIQKVWYLLNNGVKVTRSNIENIATVRKKLNEKLVDDIGYSCSMDLFGDNDYQELFKYMTKSFGDNEEYFTFKNFVVLYFQLMSLRQIQGYGCFFRIKDIDMEEAVDDTFAPIVDTLNSICEPVLTTEKVEDLFFAKKSLNYFKEKSIFAY